jgi:hypothetical protein
MLVLTALRTVYAVAQAQIGGGSEYPPARELEQVGHLAMGLLWRAALAVCLGWAVARAVRRHLHWSWGFVALGACVVACLGASGGLAAVPLIGALGTPGVLLAALVATARARALQVAAQPAAGGSVAQAPPRHAPCGLLEALVRLLPTGLRERVARVSRKGPDAAAGALFLGTVCAGRRSFGIPARHTLVVGATGAGKTVTVRRVLAEASTSMGVVVVDGKGDPELERELARLASAAGRRFLAWSPHHCTSYSPFCHGADTEIVDKALAAENWGDDYYLRLGQRFLGFAVRALRAAAREPTLRALAHYVDPANLEQLAPAMDAANPGSWDELVAALPTLDRAERQAIAGTQHRLATLAESDVGTLLEPATGRQTIDLLEVVRGAEVAYFNLNADARPALSRMLGAAIVMDLVTVAATMQRHDEYMPTVLVLDDVQAFASEPALAGIASLFARGRAVGMMLLLGTQSLADFPVTGTRHSMEQLLDNRTTLVVHRLPGYGSASRASRELGERVGQRLSEHLEARAGGWRGQGTGTRTPVTEPNLTPGDLMELETGVAVVKTSGQRPELVRIARPE